LIDDLILRHQKVLILVPEITLIAPMAQRLKSRFDDVAIYHSALSRGEKYDQYQLILQDKVQIILGTRSAVFLPVESLGLIIIDEEQDASYIQDEGVFYDAKEIAKFRANLHQIPLILGSATPSIETMYQALNQQINLLELTKRHGNISMPRITMIDMKEELKNKNTSIFSRALLDGMKKRIKKNEQIILLFNRKGFAPFVMCRSCGAVPTCPHCDISLTYYKDKNTLKCHYCGYEKPFASTCEVCSEQTVKEVGIGIEYVEKKLHEALPEARVLRMDANTTRNKGTHEMLWNQFSQHEADILLGTQMIAKGLDFPKVTLVGVLMADLSLKVPSFQASEQAYMLFTQVTGRSGRFMPGEAIIQGYDLEHYAIKNVLTQYDDFYREAIYYRKMGNYSPFKNTAQILIEGQQYLKTYQKAFALRKALLETNCDVLGPTPALIKRIKDQFRFTLTLKSTQQINTLVFDLMHQFKSNDIKMRYYPNLDKV
ncbi:MAG: primosomal protein N', partial [Acholeplasmataceae bacterium]|nr:primosomal protein N' [Acholeplasmataceae bacterium]